MNNLFKQLPTLNTLLNQTLKSKSEFRIAQQKQIDAVIKISLIYFQIAFHYWLRLCVRKKQPKPVRRAIDAEPRPESFDACTSKTANGSRRIICLCDSSVLSSIQARMLVTIKFFIKILGVLVFNQGYFSICIFIKYLKFF